MKLLHRGPANFTLSRDQEYFFLAQNERLINAGTFWKRGTAKASL